jgi:acetoin utilization protein AcuB
MIKDPICVSESASIAEALEVMKENSIRHLPVVGKAKKLAGFVTLAGLKQGLIPSMVAGLSLADLMIKKPITCRPDDDVEAVARTVYEQKIGGLPVVDSKKRLVGIITIIDILRAFVEMMGLLTPSARLYIDLGPDSGAFHKVSRIIQDNGGRIISAGIAPHRKEKTAYCFRLADKKIAAVKKALKKEGVRVLETSC